MWPNAPGWPRISFFSRWRSSIGRACVRRSRLLRWQLVVMRVQVFGPSPLMSGALALTFGALAYLCFSALQKEKRLRPYEIALLFEMSLQILLFVASGFIRDYTRFSLYYAVDILLTLTLVSFLPHILREEPHDLH